jgi:hypothetical protein
MPCLALPVPGPIVLPGGITLPIFTPPVVPGIGFCCKLPLPVFPTAAVALLLPFPPGVVDTLNGYLRAVQAAFDAVQVSCPLQ